MDLIKDNPIFFLKCKQLEAGFTQIFIGCLSFEPSPTWMKVEDLNQLRYTPLVISPFPPPLLERNATQHNHCRPSQNSANWVTFFLLFSIIQMILEEGEFNTKLQVRVRLFMDMDIWNEIRFTLSKQQI